MTTELSPTSAAPGEAGAGRADAGREGAVGTGSRGTLVLGLVALAGVVVLAILGLVATDPDVELGDTVRLLYIHVGVVSTGYLGIVVTTVASVAFLWKRSAWWDLVAASAAEISAVFIGLTLVSGMLWGKPTWGTYWEWDARLTSTLVLFLLLLGYLAVRRTAVDPGSRGRRSAIIGLLLLPNVLIVNRSVEWWRSLHQDATLFRIDPQIQDLQMFTEVFAIGVGMVIGVWLLVHRFRLAWLQDQVDRELLEGALVERRAEVPGAPGALDASGRPDGGGLPDGGGGDAPAASAAEPGRSAP